MTTTLLPTLRDLFVATKGDCAPLATVSNALGALDLRGLYDHTFDLLDINVVDILIGGWKKHQDVRAQMRATAADPSRTAIVQLSEHTLESVHNPSIEIRSQGRVVTNVSFTIEVAFDVKAVELVIRLGEVEEIRPGTITVRGTMKLEHSVLLERKLAPLRLPGRVVLNQQRAATISRTPGVTMTPSAEAAHAASASTRAAPLTAVG